MPVSTTGQHHPGGFPRFTSRDSIKPPPSNLRHPSPHPSPAAESFFSTLEFEGPATATWRTVSDAEPEMFKFIESYYNQTRLHSHNDYRTPNETESDLRNGALAA
jgi:hypothetical protein